MTLPLLCRWGQYEQEGQQTQCFAAASWTAAGYGDPWGPAALQWPCDLVCSHLWPSPGSWCQGCWWSHHCSSESACATALQIESNKKSAYATACKSKATKNQLVPQHCKSKVTKKISLHISTANQKQQKISLHHSTANQKWQTNQPAPQHCKSKATKKFIAALHVLCMLSGDCESFALTKLVWNSQGLRETVYKSYSQRDQMKTNQCLQHFNINLTMVYGK